jgi:hypothetical protein
MLVTRDRLDGVAAFFELPIVILKGIVSLAAGALNDTC